MGLLIVGAGAVSDPFPHTELPRLALIRGRYLVLSQLDMPCVLDIPRRSGFVGEKWKGETGKRERSGNCSLDVINERSFVPKSTHK